MQTVRAETPRQPRVGPDQQHETAPAADAGQGLTDLDRARRAESAEHHAGPARQAHRDRRRIRRPLRVGEKQQRRQGLPPAADAL